MHGPAGRIRLVGALVLAVLVALTWRGAPWTERQQSAWFDLYQALAPREASPAPVLVVAIDARSLRELGQWPWPRTQLARLVELIGSAKPAAIGIDLLMPEADGLSPERLAQQRLVDDPALADALRRLPTHDARLAAALAAAPVVLGVAGTPDLTRSLLRVAPVLVAPIGAAPAGEPALPRHAHALTTIDEVNARAQGWGLVSVATTRGILRRLPLVATIDGTRVPSLALEMLRVAQGAAAVRVEVAGDAVQRVAVGSLQWRTERDAGVRPYFAPPDPTRVVSAVDLLEDRVDLRRFAGRLVLVGATGAGLQDDFDTPIGERLSATAIHAELLDNLVGQTLLRRPTSAAALEAGALAALGVLLIGIVPRWRPAATAALVFGAIAAALAAGGIAFLGRRWLIDPLTPALYALGLYGLLLAMTLTEVLRQRRALTIQVQAQREERARLAGELEAAQQVQAAMLPRAHSLAGDARLQLEALLEPAREVGGDLYDFCRLDDRRLFLLVGDVAGKGLTASIFMAVSRALVKSALLRTPDVDLGALLRTANEEVSRDNPAQLFITVFAAVLDLESGWLDYCNAGHDNPYRLHRTRDEPLRITDGDGPPLCTLPGFDYRGARCRLEPGETLCLMSDGVAEARDGSGELFGAGRVRAVLRAAQARDDGAAPTLRALREALRAFVGPTEAADDLTLLTLRWNGPGR